MPSKKTDKIFTHDEATLMLELFEDVLDRYNITVPSDEDDEREPDNTGLYGSTYSELLDGVENQLIEILERCKKGTKIVTGIYSGAI